MLITGQKKISKLNSRKYCGKKKPTATINNLQHVILSAYKSLVSLYLEFCGLIFPPQLQWRVKQTKKW